MNYKRKEDINRFLLKYKEDLKETDDFLIDAEDLYDDLVRINTKENIKNTFDYRQYKSEAVTWLNCVINGEN